VEEVTDAKRETPVTTCIVLDGAAIVQKLQTAASKTFEEYAQHIVSYMSTKLQTMSRLDLVWDTYFADSLIGSTRSKRGQGVRRRVVATAAIPGNWQNFLRVDSDKNTELLRFLSAALMEWFNQEDKQLVTTNGEAVLNKPVLPDLTSLVPFNHEEADTRMLLYASHAAQHGRHAILIRTVDTDVVVLAVSLAQELQSKDKLWLAFETS